MLVTNVFNICSTLSFEHTFVLSLTIDLEMRPFGAKWLPFALVASVPLINIGGEMHSEFKAWYLVPRTNLLHGISPCAVELSQN
jgi:hypothetical protein